MGLSKCARVQARRACIFPSQDPGLFGAEGGRIVVFPLMTDGFGNVDEDPMEHICTVLLYGVVTLHMNGGRVTCGRTVQVTCRPSWTGFPRFRRIAKLRKGPDLADIDLRPARLAVQIIGPSNVSMREDRGTAPFLPCLVGSKRAKPHRPDASGPPRLPGPSSRPHWFTSNTHLFCPQLSAIPSTHYSHL